MLENLLENVLSVSTAEKALLAVSGLQIIGLIKFLIAKVPNLETHLKELTQISTLLSEIPANKDKLERPADQD